MRKKSKSVILLFCFIISIIFTSNLLNFGLATIQEEDISIEWGDNVYQNLPYTYSGTFYDDADPTFVWTTSKIEYQYIPDSTVTYSHSIIAFENQETQYPTNTSITMVNGTHYQNGTLNSLDDDYHIFNSTTPTTLIPIQPDNFTFVNGTSNFEGDLKYIDSNYTMFNSTESGHYPATYSFTDDGAYSASGWTFGQAGGTVIVNSLVGGHRKVLDLHDTDNVNSVNAYTEFDEQTGTFTVELWWRNTDQTKYHWISFRDGASHGVFIAVTSSTFRYFDGDAWQNTGITATTHTWFHHRVDIYCGNNTFDWYIDDINYFVGAVFWNNIVDGIDDMMISTDGVAVDYHVYIDAVGFYPLDTDYTIGDNKNPIPTLVNLTADLNLDSFSSLDDLNLVYSYRTNIYQLCNFSIYNFDNSEYDLIESAVNLTFQNCYFELNSSYYNATNDLILKFEMSNTTNDFRMELDRLVIRHSSYLNFTTYVNFEKLINFLQLDIKSYQRSNISQLIGISAWDWDNEEWDLLDSSSYITTFQLADYSSSTVFDEYIDNSTGQVLLCYYGVNKTDNFEFHLDQLKFDIYFKTEFEYEKILYLLGTWKYRFVLDDGLGTEHNQDWIYFNVIEQRSNFEGISESKYATRWVLTSTATTGYTTIDFNDDLTTGSWSLTDFSTRELNAFSGYPVDDSWVWNQNPDTNYDPDQILYVWTTGPPDYYEKDAFMEHSITTSYFTDNFSSSYLRFYTQNTLTNDRFYLRSMVELFDESTITWTNRPTTIKNNLGDKYFTGTGPHYWYFNKGLDDKCFILRHSSGYYFEIYSKEASSSYRPTFNFIYYKNGHITSGDGYAYIQTDETELLGLRSPKYSQETSLSEGDYFTVDLQTTSDNAQMKLYLDGSPQKTLNVLVGNTETGRQEVEVYIDSDISFDQVKITSELTDTEYLKLYDIQGNHWNFETEADQRSMYVEPFGQNEIIANYGNNTLKIYENNILQVETYVDIGYDLITYVFESTLPETVFVSFFDLNNEYLDFNQFKVYINYTLYEESYTNQRLTNREFFVDEGSTIYFEVNDSFNVNIYSASRLAKTFMDITLNVYSLKIKNEATKEISYTLTKGSISKSGWILPEEIIEYFIATGSYQLDYVNYEDMALRTYNFSLNEHSLITINTTYHTVYFGLFTYDGLGLNRDWVRFYINGVRKDFGRNIIQSETAHLIVLDYFNNTLANETIDASAYLEYNIFIEIYSLIILNQFTYEDIIVNITQVDSGVWMTQIIPKQFGLTYRFLPYVEYNITIYFTNATLYTSRIVNLTTNSHIESFGVPTTTPEYPKEVYFGVYTTTALGINHNLLRFYIDNVRTDFGFNRIENMIITITVKDYFNTTLFNQNVNTSGIYEYNILITLYSLKVKNEARETSNYTLKLGVLETTGFILPEEIIEYQLSSNNYVFEFTNNEDDSFHTININLDENKVYIINSTYYTTYFGLFDQYNHRLDNSLFSLYLNGTRKDFGFIELSSEYYNITVYDWLNISVFNQIIYLFDYTEYNIYITVFEFQIRHLAQENSNFSLYETTSGNYINFSMSPDTITSYILSSSTYNLIWVNGENMQTSYYYITLDSNYVLTLSSIYHGVYFALFTYDGLGINYNLVKFYINESRKDFGFNMMSSAFAEIVVLDFFNTTLFNQTIDFSSLSEYNIFIEIYSLIILNQFTYEDIITNITQIGSGIWLNHIIPKQFALSCRFAPNMNYTINVYYVNNSLYTTRTINLTENNHIESFGTPTLPSEYPKDIYFSVYTGTGLAIDQLLLKFYIDGDRADFGFNTIGSVMVSIVVKDFFNTTLFNQNVNTSGIYEYDILIDIYSLKIKNEALRIVNYTLNLGTLTDTGNILPDEIIEYQLSTNSYIFEYTNQEDNSFGSISFTLDEDKVYILNSTYYDIYFSLYDVNLHTFYSTQYEFRLNNTIQDLGLVVDLQSDNYNITIKDRFGTYLFNNIINLRGLNEYRIEISLFELQIRHLAEENSNLTLIEDISNNTYSFIMTPDSIKSILMGSSNYTLNWTNGENNQLTMFSINLTSDAVIKLNTTYYDIHFGLFNFDGLGLERDLFRFYINSERKDLGFNTLKYDTNNLKILDYFGAILFDSVINTRQYTEYNIYVEVWALILHNNYSHAIYIEIERNDYEIRQLIPAHSSIQYRFLPNIRYEIRVYDTDNNKLHEETVELDENNKIVSFGFYSTYVPRDPLPLINSFTMLIWFAIFVIFILFIIIVLYVRFKKEKASIPIELRRFIKQKKKKSNIKKNGYSDKDIYID